MNANKLLVGTLGMVATLGISTSSLAYYGVVANEFQPGFYIGLQAGFAQSWWSDLDSITDNFPSLGLQWEGTHGDWAARGDVGYDFNEFFAIELGLGYFKGGRNSLTTVPGGVVLYEQHPKAFAVDLEAKLSLPLDNGFRLFMKAGGQFYKSSHAPLFFDGLPIVEDQENRKVGQVLFGVGASYAITTAFSADLAWTFYRGTGTFDDKYMPNTDFYSLGLTYKFACS